MEQTTLSPFNRTQVGQDVRTQIHPDERVSARHIGLAGLYRRCGPRQTSKGDEGNDKGCDQKVSDYLPIFEICPSGFPNSIKSEALVQKSIHAVVCYPSPQTVEFHMGTWATTPFTRQLLVRETSLPISVVSVLASGFPLHDTLPQSNSFVLMVHHN